MEYERARRIAAAPGDVFAFVSNIETLPDYVATVKEATRVAGERIRIRGTIDGATYTDDGWLHLDPDRHRIEWRDDEHEYRGWMTITNDDGGSQVVTHLSLPPHYSRSGRPLTGEHATEPDPIEESLEAAMDSLRHLIEGTGGKERPAMTT